MEPTYEELKAENQKLKRAISPLEDPIFTSELEEKLKGLNLAPYIRHLRKGPHYVLFPAELWQELYGSTPNTHEVTVIGRSLQALLWERSASNGARVFVKRVEE